MKYNIDLKQKVKLQCPAQYSLEYNILILEMLSKILPFGIHTLLEWHSQWKVSGWRRFHCMQYICFPATYYGSIITNPIIYYILRFLMKVLFWYSTSSFQSFYPYLFFISFSFSGLVFQYDINIPNHADFT